jgi:hypothetical protein
VSSSSFGKREREKQQRERAEAKRQRRADRTPIDAPDAEDLERFRLVSEAFASGAIDRATYQAERRAILSALGLTDAFEEPS